MTIAPALVLNAALFQVGWWLCVLGGDRIAAIAVCSVLLLHWLYVGRESAEWLCIALSGVFGSALDGVMHGFGVLQFSGLGGCAVPLWLVALWLIFATTLNHSLRWLQAHWRWAALLGASAAPLSYWGGVRLGAAQFGITTPLALAILAGCWGLLLPLLSAMMGHRTRVLSLCKHC